MSCFEVIGETVVRRNLCKHIALFTLKFLSTKAFILKEGNNFYIMRYTFFFLVVIFWFFFCFDLCEDKISQGQFGNLSRKIKTVVLCLICFFFFFFLVWVILMLCFFPFPAVPENVFPVLLWVFERSKGFVTLLVHFLSVKLVWSSHQIFTTLHSFKLLIQLIKAKRHAQTPNIGN